jgi:hypothetical protein
MESAMSVATTDHLCKDAGMDGLASLSEKSLLQIDVTGPTIRCRLLDSTRAYALAKLRDAGDLCLLSCRHAERIVELLIQAEEDWDEISTPEWVALDRDLTTDFHKNLHLDVQSKELQNADLQFGRLSGRGSDDRGLWTAVWGAIASRKRTRDCYPGIAYRRYGRHGGSV